MTAVFFSKASLTVEAQLLREDDSCRLVTFLPFTDMREGPDPPHANEGQYGYGNWPSQAHLSNYSTALLAAAEMARRHFVSDTRNIVPTNLFIYCLHVYFLFILVYQER